MNTAEIIKLAKRRATSKLMQLGFYKVSYQPDWFQHGIIVQGNYDDIDIDKSEFVISKHSGFYNYYEDKVCICLT